MLRLLEAVVIAVAVALATSVWAPALAAADCNELGAFARRMATFRDVGADLRKMKLALRKDAPLGAYGATYPQLVRILEQVFKDGRAGDDAAASVFMYCTARLGDLGSDS